MPLTPTTYIQTVKKHLLQHSETLTERIREVVSFSYSKKVDLLDFQVFLQPFEQSIMLFTMDRKANEVFMKGEQPGVFAGSHELLGNAVYYKMATESMDAFYEFYEQHDTELEEAEQRVVTEWFVDCWIKAEGNRLALPVYFDFHDSTASFDMHRKVWVKEEEKWQASF
ncbi:hypothetical protein AB1K83_10410 [Sporosarcina sp. 179-K 3D1 HS]|uniref:hypothetical protein n=1 Tax=Sporosarcina sp. 179-K 3D1 HS TaxID=3232169 RepID=UPI0039A14426